MEISLRVQLNPTVIGSAWGSVPENQKDLPVDELVAAYLKPMLIAAINAAKETGAPEA